MDGMSSWDDILRTVAPHYQALYKTLSPEMLEATGHNCNCHCPSACTVLEYSTDVTYDTLE